MIELYVPSLREQVKPLLEYEPSHVRLVVRSGHAHRAPVGLTLDLDLWLTLGGGLGWLNGKHGLA